MRSNHDGSGIARKTALDDPTGALQRDEDCTGSLAQLAGVVRGKYREFDFNDAAWILYTSSADVISGRA